MDLTGFQANWDVCAVCSGTFEQDGEMCPHVLLCGHSFCAKDIQAMCWNRISLSCPICNSYISLKNFAGGFPPKNFTAIQALLQEKAGVEQYMCSECQSLATQHCPQCESDFCDSCNSLVHLPNTTFAFHTPHSLGDEQENVEIDEDYGQYAMGSFAGGVSAHNVAQMPACMICGEAGHIARNCPVPTNTIFQSSTSNGGLLPNPPTAQTRACFKCGDPGHMANACTASTQTRNVPQRACFKCGDTGHMANACTSSTQGRTIPQRAAGQGRACFKCGDPSHMANACTASTQGRNVPQSQRAAGLKRIFNSNATNVGSADKSNLASQEDLNNDLDDYFLQSKSKKAAAKPLDDDLDAYWSSKPKGVTKAKGITKGTTNPKPKIVSLLGKRK